MRKQFLVLSGDSNTFVLNSRISLCRFAKSYGYSFRQIMVGINYEGTWVGKNHQIMLRS